MSVSSATWNDFTLSNGYFLWRYREELLSRGRVRLTFSIMDSLQWRALPPVIPLLSPFPFLLKRGSREEKERIK